MILPPQKIQRQKPSLTPLIDVVFILLIFFMLATTLNHESSLSIASIESSDKGGDSLEESRSLLILMKSGKVRWQGRTRSIAQTIPDLREHDLQNQSLQIRVSKKVTVQQLVHLMSALQKGGFLNLSFLTDKEVEG